MDQWKQKALKRHEPEKKGAVIAGHHHLRALFFLPPRQAARVERSLKALRGEEKKNDFWEQLNWRFTKKGKNNYAGVNRSHAEVATSQKIGGQGMIFFPVHSPQ